MEPSQLGEKEQVLIQNIDRGNIPSHVAIIMDGNGRWAAAKELPRREGHRRGVETVREIVRFSNNIGIKILTLYAFSTENWQRPAWEVNYLMGLPEKYFQSELPELVRNNVRVKLIGDQTKLPAKVRKAVNNGIEATENNTGMILSFALNYGSRMEVLRAVNMIIDDAALGKHKRKLSEKQFEKYLYTGDMADPDLLIRTGGEYRLSNFLLWQLAYTELWFTAVYWPDFTGEHLLQAIIDFQQRKRRFGTV